MRKVVFLAALLVGLTVAGPAWAAEDELVVPPQTFTVELEPSVDPSGDPDGSGTAELTVDLKAKTVCYDITVTNIGVPTEPIAGIGNAHIHSHPDGGAIAVDLDTQFAALADVENTYQAKDCVKAKRRAVVDILLHPEDYYVNVHTVDFPGGAVQGDLAQVIDQGLPFGPFRGEQGFTVEGGGQSLIFGGHSLSVTGQESKQLDEHHVLSPPSLRRDLGYRHATP